MDPNSVTNNINEGNATNEIKPEWVNAEQQVPVEPIQPQIDPINNVPEPKSNLVPILLFILIISVLGVGGFLIYKSLSSQKPVATSTSTSTPVATTDPTSDWKTYTDTKHGLSFKYPQSWTIKIDNLDSSNLITGIALVNTNTKAEGNFESSDMQYSLRIYYIPNLKNQQEAMSSENQTEGVIGLGSQSVVSFGDNKFIKFGGSGQYSTTQYGIQTKTDNQYVVFDMTPGNITNTEVQNSYNQILSTFKFNDGDTSLDTTTNWKTYTNNVMSVSMKYPPNWTAKESTNKKSVNFETGVASSEKQDDKTISYILNLQIEDPNNFQIWSNDSTTTKLTSISTNGLTFERFIVADMGYSLNYILTANDGKIYRFYLYPYTKSELQTSLDSTIIQILSTFKFN